MSDKRARGPHGGVSRRTFFRTAGIAAAAGALFREVPAMAQDAKAPAIRAQGPGPVKITLLVNGAKREVAVEPRKTLLDTLRTDIDLTGAKRVCRSEERRVGR